MHPITAKSPPPRGSAQLRRGVVAMAALAFGAALAAVLSCADFGSPFVPDAATVTIDGATQRSIRAGETLDLVAEVRDASGRLIPSAAVEWISSAPATAALEPRGPLAGRARAAAVGSAMIVARSGRVQSPPLELAVLPREAGSVTIVTPASPMMLPVGQTAQFAAEVRANDGSILPDPPLIWLSSNPGVLSIDAAGLANALAAGSATIQARSADMLSAGVAVTVHNPAPSYAAAIQPIWNANCTRCHGSDGGLTLSGDAYERIVNVTSTQNRAFKRIVPGNPGASYMLRKLEGCSTAGCVGGSMPPGLPLPAAQLQLIRDWVMGGCPR